MWAWIELFKKFNWVLIWFIIVEIIAATHPEIAGDAIATLVIPAIRIYDIGKEDGKNDN